ncbi:exodeoxyribonuclease VII large subunit [Desulfitobacterium metallireducens]|uniref:Exodeoxyribonuclease 7 large subunit n=1 Tax=Desulfitobacterium metallireducens DSM 15288 TaxID=871968 RepID=W0ECX9_9FIRM|nr:exodeoxyribonuclease VII large subunit [Desulfitobacterium metallireducens]AHF07378.1 exodeoxyribonuclease VII large subunit [Desulfitobacterium metallireducens DSM 15288]
MPKIWTVAELTTEISRTLSDNDELVSCWVSGELSNYKNHRPSGHWYFTLKDQSSSIKAVMFRSRAERVQFIPQDGMKVLLRGSVKVYERDGNVQLYVDEMQPSGVGALYLAFEQLKQRLSAEGLFDPERKKPIPRIPRRVGIVTSPTGAAIRDILKVMGRRDPHLSWILAPAAVQGEQSPREVAQAIERLNRYGQIDVLIVGRGGGSLEELWAFNTEEVARAIANSAIPIISAVGHETDVTIADMVADMRAPTPSAAAELAVPIFQELRHDVEDLSARLQVGIKAQIGRKREKINRLAASGPLLNPLWRIEQNRQRLDNVSTALQQEMTRFVSDKNGILKLLATKLDLLSPLAILGRGYSLTYSSEGKLLRSSTEANAGDHIKVRLNKGALTCQVLTKESEG